MKTEHQYFAKTVTDFQDSDTMHFIRIPGVSGVSIQFQWSVHLSNKAGFMPVFVQFYLIQIAGQR
jgi:hypothetical protein